LVVEFLRLGIMRSDIMSRPVAVWVGRLGIDQSSSGGLEHQFEVRMHNMPPEE
jgi:hypothetical protein